MKEEYPVSRQTLLEEIRLNRAAIHCVEEKLSGKVGRGELVGWMTVVGLIVTIVVAVV